MLRRCCGADLHGLLILLQPRFECVVHLIQRVVISILKRLAKVTADRGFVDVCRRLPHCRCLRLQPIARDVELVFRSPQLIVRVFDAVR